VFQYFLFRVLRKEMGTMVEGKKSSGEWSFTHTSDSLPSFVAMATKNPHCFRNEGCPTLWAHLGSNQGPLDYESSALTN